jgi:hypothetical protein
MSGAAQSTGVSFKRRALRQKILNVALTSKEFRDTLSEAATEIRELAKPTATEATIEGAFERVLYARLRDIDLRFHPEKESGVNLRRHLARGRMDSRLGALVIEYKRPSLLKGDAEISKALDQLGEYIASLSKSAHAPLVGILTNGLVGVEVRAIEGMIITTPAPAKIDGAFLLRLTRHFISLALTALTPENLIRDFCGSQADGVLFQTARVLNSALAEPQLKTKMLHSEWEEMFRLAHDDQSQQKRIEERRTALAALFEIEISDSVGEYRALFALHTAYAVLLKFMAYRTVSDIYLGSAGNDYGSLATASNSSLRAFCEDLEDGDVFRRLGIINLLEGDFFSWYCDRHQWTPSIAEAMRSILETLARYEEAGHIFEANEAPDLFRELYQAAVPRVVRSSFGEFYTPYWLADHVIESASPRGRWRAIDPCCGSGTFVIAAIARVRRECERRHLNDRDTLQEIVSRVVAIDLNPLGVLTTRINYFIHISALFGTAKTSLMIPVFLGDAAAIPDRVVLDGVSCLRIELKTLKSPIKTTLPTSVVEDTASFMQLMLLYEQKIKSQKRDEAKATLLKGIKSEHLTFSIRKAVSDLTDSLIELEQNGWNGIWARILSNFLTTACLGQFSVVVGNPPWIDWRNLPAGYRERIKGMCIDRGLFSGAGRTGGINLNICALISYVAMTNWMRPGGRLAFLMPKELANQASYEGWRRLGNRWRFLELHDWSKVGHPFDPVREDFMTFVLGQSKHVLRSIPISYYRKKASITQKASDWKSTDAAADSLDVTHGVAGQIIANSTAFTFAKDQAELDEFALVAGQCEYIGRQGVEFYPQELLLFKYAEAGPCPGTVWIHNVQMTKAKYRVQRRRILLETVYLRPLVKGAEIGQFEHDYDGLIAAFPYEVSDPLRPVSADTLREKSPLLLDYYERAREIMGQQTRYTDKIRGTDPGEFYGLARTGPYTFASTYVAFHDNTKWGAAVFTDTALPWGQRSPFIFQKHAVSMSERRSEESFITEDEAHFVCAILNAPIVERFISATSDNRSFKIRPPIFVPLYDAEDDRHAALVSLSREAHAHPDRREALRSECEGIYLSLCGDEAFDAMVARDRLEEIESGQIALVTGDALQAELNSLLA